jgi:hypothetical protein
MTDEFVTLLEDRDELLIAACEAVNADACVAETVDDWQAITDVIREPWNERTQ